jgi:hypothetical protein
MNTTDIPESNIHSMAQMDEAVINGANIFFASQFGIDPDESDRNQWLFGLVNSAPYLCCAFVGCWLTDPVTSRSSLAFI